MSDQAIEADERLRRAAKAVVYEFSSTLDPYPEGRALRAAVDAAGRASLGDSQPSGMRRAVFVELVNATEGVTVRDLRRRMAAPASPSEIAGALRAFYNAGLAVKSAAKDARWWPTPAAHIAAETLAPEVFD